MDVIRTVGIHVKEPVVIHVLDVGLAVLLDVSVVQELVGDAQDVVLGVPVVV